MATVKLNGRLTGLELALKKNLEIRKAQKNKYKTYAKSRACLKSANLKRQANAASKLAKKINPVIKNQILEENN